MRIILDCVRQGGRVLKSVELAILAFHVSNVTSRDGHNMLALLWA